MASSADICSFFFEPVYDPDAPPPVPSPPPSPSAPKKRGRKKHASLGGANRHRCKLCHNVYSQATSTGYTNLLTHLRIKHPNWEEMFKLQQLDATVPVAVASSETSEEIATESPFRIQSSSATSSASKRGRKRGPVYDHFEEIPSSPGNKQKKMRCVYCHEDTSQLSGRMKFHLSARCPEVPEDVKNKYAGGVALMSSRIEGVVTKAEAVEVDTVSKATSIATPEKPTTMLTSPVTTLKPPVTTFKPPSIKLQQSPALKTSSQAPVPNQTKREAGNLRVFEEKLTTALVTTNAPWSLLDNANFREAMKTLHPASANFPLSSARARGEILDRLTQKYDRDCHEILSASNAITLVVNETDVEEDETKKTTYVALDEWRRAFVLAKGNNASTSPYMADVLSIVSDLPITPRTKLFLCAPTSGAYARVRLEPHPSASASGKLFTLLGACMTQQTALFLHELVLCSMSLEEALDNAILTADALHVIPSLRQRVLRGIFPGKCGENANAFVQVSVTSWRSTAMAVNQATRLEPFLRLAISEEKPVSPILRQLLDMRSSEMAWNSLRHTTQLLTPLHFISVLSELQTTTSGQLLSLWIWLFGAATRSPLLDGNSDALITTFMQRLECYVEEHFIACLVLDPRVHGAGLSVSGLRRARAVTVRVAAALVPGFNENNFIRSYNDYMKQQGDFGESSLWNAVNTANPMEFWGDYEGDQLHNQLAVVAKTVCSFVPHTCSLEELWTAHAQRTKAVHTYVSKQQEKCTKIRHGAALSARANAKEIVSRFLPLLEVDNEPSVEEMLQSNAAYQDKVEQKVNTRNLSVRSVLESVQDGMEEDAAGSNASSTSIDASWFDISSTGLDKIRSTMQNYLRAAMQQ